MRTMFEFNVKGKTEVRSPKSEDGRRKLVQKLRTSDSGLPASPVFSTLHFSLLTYFIKNHITIDSFSD